MFTKGPQKLLLRDLAPAYLQQTVNQDTDHASQVAVSGKLQPYPGPVWVGKNQDLAEVANRGIVPVGRQAVRLEVFKL